MTDTKKPEETKKPEDTKASRLQKAFGARIDWAAYDKEAKLAVDVDLSICTAEERPRMVAIVNRLAKSPAGRETLEIAAEGGFQFGFLMSADQSFGTCFPSQRKIGLNPNASDDKLIGTLCHEARHAGQAIRDIDGRFGRSQLDVASILRTSRAKEADAQVYAVVACGELAAMGDAEPAAQFKEYYPEIDKAFNSAVAANGGKVDASVKMETFKAWYDQDRTKQAYEESYILEPMNMALAKYKQGYKTADYQFDRSTSAEQVAELIGWTKEGSYFIDSPQILDEGKFISVGERSKEDMLEFSKQRQEIARIKPDKTIESLPTTKDALPRRRPLMGEKEPETAENNAPQEAIKKWKATQTENKTLHQRLSEATKNPKTASPMELEKPRLAAVLAQKKSR